MERTTGRAGETSKRSRKSIQNQVHKPHCLSCPILTKYFCVCRTKCDVTEEEAIAQEFLELFPTYHTTDFQDYTQNDLNDNGPNEPENTQQIPTTTISQQDIEFVTDLHVRFMLHCTRTEWLCCRNENKLRADFVGPLIEKMKLCKQILENCIDSFNHKFDLVCLNALNVLVAVAQRYGDVSFAGASFIVGLMGFSNTFFCLDVSSPTHMADKKGNFYKDANVAEVQASFDVLESLKIQIRKLLDEWPGHPTLQTVLYFHKNL